MNQDVLQRTYLCMCTIISWYIGICILVNIENHCDVWKSEGGGLDTHIQMTRGRENSISLSPYRPKIKTHQSPKWIEFSF